MNKKLKFSNKSPCQLVRNNMDRGCALDGCPKCGHKEINSKYIGWERTLKIICICKAPWVGGITGNRPLAIVYECQKCFEYSWFHTTKGHKDTLEELLNEGIIKFK